MHYWPPYKLPETSSRVGENPVEARFPYQKSLLQVILNVYSTKVMSALQTMWNEIWVASTQERKKFMVSLGQVALTKFWVTLSRIKHHLVRLGENRSRVIETPRTSETRQESRASQIWNKNVFNIVHSESYRCLKHISRNSISKTRCFVQAAAPKN